MKPLLFVSLLIVVALVVAEAPSFWQPRISQAQLLYAEQEPSNDYTTYVGNGFVAHKVLSDFFFIAGVYNGLPVAQDKPSHRAEVPATDNIDVSGSIIGAAIDLERALYLRLTKVAASEGTYVAEQRWYAHRLFRSLFVHEIYPLAEAASAEVSICIARKKLADSPDFTFKFADSGIPNVIALVGTTLEQETSTTPPNRIVMLFTNSTSTVCTKISQQKPLVFLTVVKVNTEYSDPNVSFEDMINDARAEYNKYSELSSQQGDREVDSIRTSKLLDLHLNEWDNIWSGGIEVAGNLEVAQAINSSLYYILSSIRNDWEYSLSPGSLSSNAYNGHVFWDCETWMYPTILMFYPDLAQSILNYRFHRIPQAEQKALSYKRGWTGAMFPWESAQTGVETTPTSAATGQLEHHISGDIAFAARQYYRTQFHPSRSAQVGYTKQVVLPLVRKIAEFWSSRVTARVGTLDQFDIKGVIPPDEYVENVNNSIYTNVVAQIALQFAISLTNEVDPSLPVPTKWPRVVSGLYMPYNKTGNYHPEYEGFIPDPNNPKQIKQADVILLGFPLQWDGLKSQPGSREKDLKVYIPVTDPSGPAMTYSMHAVGHIEIGDVEGAAPLFTRSYANIRPPFNIWVESVTWQGAINFITGAGGFLQGVLFGYGGLRTEQNPLYPDAKSLTFNPTLLPNSTFVRFRNIDFLGHHLDISYDQRQVAVMDTNQKQQSFKLSIQVEGEKDSQTLEENIPVNVPRNKKFYIFTRP